MGSGIHLQPVSRIVLPRSKRLTVGYALHSTIWNRHIQVEHGGCTDRAGRVMSCQFLIMDLRHNGQFLPSVIPLL